MPLPFLKNIHRLLVYRRLIDDSLIRQLMVLTRMLNDRGRADNLRVEQFFYQIAHQLVNDPFLQALRGDLWKNHVLRLLAEDENIFSLAAEQAGSQLDHGLLEMVRGDMLIINDIYSLDLMEMAGLLGFEFPYPLAGGALKHSPPSLFESSLHQAFQELTQVFNGAVSRDMVTALGGFYQHRGCGLMARYAAFRWDQGLVGVAHPDPVSFDDLIGYERQKSLLIANTESFLKGRRANNVLLHGEKGTGKSSSIKALLNRYSGQGLRMVELPKHQLRELPRVINSLQDRGLYFIIFIDDLSFEDFEVDYKHIKACIEGGLEVRPDNALLYVTSNRRNLIKEYFRDRRADSEEVHVSDSYQEKTSFADRFGLSISYYSPDKEEYLSMVESMARQAGISMQDEELRRQAVQWGVSRNGWSGRVARQFIYSLEGV